MNRRNFLKLIGGVAAVALLPNIPLPKQKPKHTVTGTDGREYECVATYRGKENPIFKGSRVIWDNCIVYKIG